MLKPRVRIAPSPTGEPHLGHARTALFNWLFARKHGGAFVLRFEDTDTSRSTMESAELIMEGMRWLGLDWDEGPYFQMQRLDLYRTYAEQLLREGKAYRCYCTPEELEQRRQQAIQEKRKPKYDGRCRNLSPDKEQKFIAAGRQPVLRLRVPDSGITSVEDLIKGHVDFENKELDDFIILRSDGRPTYNFAVVVDDITMNITHIIRGDEHLNNTPKQILLYEAFGYAWPKFAHAPMILGKDRSKLSKRHGAKSLFEYRAQGYLPEALINFVARLGWSYDDKQEIFSLDELIEKFSLEAVGKAAALYDEEKLLWLNHHYIKTGDTRRLAELLREFLVKQKIVSAEEASKERLIGAVNLLRERNRTLVELAESARYIFSDQFEYEAVGLKFLTPEVAPLLREVAHLLSTIDDFKAPILEEAVRDFLEKNAKSLKELAQPCRVALTGRTEGPGLFETMEILGQTKVIARLQRAIELIGKSLEEG